MKKKLNSYAYIADVVILTASILYNFSDEIKKSSTLISDIVSTHHLYFPTLPHNYILAQK